MRSRGRGRSRQGDRARDPRELIASLGAEHVIEFAGRGQTVGTGVDPVRPVLAALPSVEKVVHDGGAAGAYLGARCTGRAALLSALSEQGLEPTQLTTHHATLEDVFMALTGRRLRDG